MLWFKRKERFETEQEKADRIAYEQRLNHTKEVMISLNHKYMRHYGEQPFNLGMGIEEFMIRAADVLNAEIDEIKRGDSVLNEPANDEFDELAPAVGPVIATPKIRKKRTPKSPIVEGDEI